MIFLLTRRAENQLRDAVKRDFYILKVLNEHGWYKEGVPLLDYMNTYASNVLYTLPESLRDTLSSVYIFEYNKIRIFYSDYNDGTAIVEEIVSASDVQRSVPEIRKIFDKNLSEDAKSSRRLTKLNTVEIADLYDRKGNLEKGKSSLLYLWALALTLQIALLIGIAVLLD